MLRVFVLIGFTYLFLHLHATGDISKYINMKYSYISESAIYIFVLFTIISVYNYVKKDKHSHDGTCDQCGHDHSHEENSWWKRGLTIITLLIPVITGLILPVATLDSNIVEKRDYISLHMMKTMNIASINSYSQIQAAIMAKKDMQK